MLNAMKTMEDVTNLQHDLDTVYKQTNGNNMVLNDNKFEILILVQMSNLRMQPTIPPHQAVISKKRTKCVALLSLCQTMAPSTNILTPS